MFALFGNIIIAGIHVHYPARDRVYHVFGSRGIHYPARDRVYHVFGSRGIHYPARDRVYHVFGSRGIHYPAPIGAMCSEMGVYIIYGICNCTLSRISTI